MTNRTPKGMLPRTELVRTSELDQGEWNYEGVLGWISRQRLTLARRALAGTTNASLLEVGYGSGVFMPSWSAYAAHLAGVDVHERPDAVAAVLRRHGLDADLRHASVTEMPFDDGSFDRVVAVSALEFVDDLHAAALEMRRVLRRDGRVVVITPGHGRVLDAGLEFLTGERAEDTFQGRRQRIIPTLKQHFDVEVELGLPPIVPRSLRLYTALRLR